jgi:hypothetical protein
MDRRKGEMMRLANGIVQQVVQAASDVLTADTPVKTGAARSNWIGTIDAPFEGTIPPYHPYLDLGQHEAAPPERKFETANLGAARTQNRLAAVNYDVMRNSVYFLRNNVLHIGLLNEGWSQQTPAPGFFQRGVAAARKAIIGRWHLAD